MKLIKNLQIFQLISLLQQCQMNLFDSKYVKYGTGALGLTAILYGIFKAFRFFMQRTIESPTLQINVSSQSTLSQSDQIEHIPYDTLIEDTNKLQICSGAIHTFPHVKDICYRIIFSLMKGNSYQGIVNLTFFLADSFSNDLTINFNGSGVKFMMVNNIALDSRDVQYQNHSIVIPTNLLKLNNKNSIEIIYQNHYSFMNNGMSAYLTIDQNQKYSLRQQVIYSINGYLEVQKILPCLNCTNPCKVSVEVIHPQTFEVFSNGPKSMERFCSVSEYQKYPFLFDFSSNSLNKSFKLNSSTISNSSERGSGARGDAGSQFSMCNYYNRKKANTHFFPEKLGSIHQLFLFSSVMVELQPESVNIAVQQFVLLRYFCKHSDSHKIEKKLNEIHQYILNVYSKLTDLKIKEFVNKIDVLIISDKQVEGYFAPGIILLSQESMKGQKIECHTQYLIARAIMGMISIKNGENVQTLSEILRLNAAVFNKFQDFRDFLFIKNYKYSKIRRILQNKELKDYLTQNETHLLKYFSKELKYLVLSKIDHKISFELNNLMNSFNQNTQEQFWLKLIENKNKLQSKVVDPMIKLGIKIIKVPLNPVVLDKLKLCFSDSKYYLHFYTNQQISQNLPKFTERNTYGLQIRMTQLKIKQKFKSFITEKYQKYIPIKSNIAEAEAIYSQFKHFNQTKNFHHISLLKSEIKRVQYLGKDFIRPERVIVNCSIACWKLFRKIKIYPQDDKSYEFLKIIQEIQQ